MEKIYSRTTTIQEDKVSGFCPGCMHSTVIKLIGEVLDEMKLVDKAVAITGIGCCGLHMDYIAYDTITAPHGRACAVATGMKRTSPDSLIFTYQGDGDFASIGLGESISAANRGENITVIFINNGIYGMTGGQMAPTTLLGMKASTAPKSLIAEEHGSLSKFLRTLRPGGTLFINSSIVDEQDVDREDVKVVKAPVTEMALEMGNSKVLNVIMLGVYVGYTEVVPPEVVWSTIEHKLGKKPKLLPLNKQAFETGLKLGREQRA